MGVTDIQQGGMVLPYLWASLTLVLLALSINHTEGSAIISEEDLIRALLARGGSQEGYDNLDQDVRPLGKRARQAGFSSWAGKRGGRNQQQAFSSWAGKRSGRNQQQAFSSWAGKRAPFNSWAGKRSSEEDLITEPEYVRRKRSSDESDLAEPDPVGGQDADDLLHGAGEAHGRLHGAGARFARDLRDNSAVVKDQVYRPVRATFSAWGGKRSQR